MHVMIATDGHVDPEEATQLVGRLGREGKVTVLTVIEVPRKMLNDMREAATGASQSAANTVRLVEASAASTGTSPAGPTGWIGDDAAIAQYINSRTITATQPLVEALDAAGVAHEVVAIEAEDSAQTIIDQAADLSVDVLVIGTRGLGRFEGLLGSISTKIARRAGCSVLLIR